MNERSNVTAKSYWWSQNQITVKVSRIGVGLIESVGLGLGLELVLGLGLG